MVEPAIKKFFIFSIAICLVAVVGCALTERVPPVRPLPQLEATITNHVTEDVTEGATGGTQPAVIPVIPTAQPEIRSDVRFTREVFLKDSWTRNLQLTYWQQKYGDNYESSTLTGTDVSQSNHFSALNRAKRGTPLEMSLSYAAPAGQLVSTWRWFHPELESLFANPALTLGANSSQYITNLLPQLNDESPLVVANTAIVLGRWYGEKYNKNKTIPAEIIPVLLDVCENTNYSVPLRSAAVETLAKIPAADPDILLQHCQSQLDKSKLPNFPNDKLPLVLEWLTATSGRVSPLDNSPLIAALDSPKYPIREKAMEILKNQVDTLCELCVSVVNEKGNGKTDSAVLFGTEEESAGRTVLLEAVVRRTGDPSDRIRASAYLTLARLRHPETTRFLQIGLKDSMAEVRCAAIRGLGIDGSTEAVALLITLAKDTTVKDNTRAQLVFALRDVKKWDEILTMSQDSSAAVRTAVASVLGEYPSPKSKQTVVKYLDDVAVVHRAALISVSQWPPEEAVPILIDGLAKRARSVSDTAKSLLIPLLPAATDFHFDDSADRKQEIIANLRTLEPTNGNAGITEPAALAMEQSSNPAQNPALTLGTKEINQDTLSPEMDVLFRRWETLRQHTEYTAVRLRQEYSQLMAELLATVRIHSVTSSDTQQLLRMGLAETDSILLNGTMDVFDEIANISPTDTKMADGLRFAAAMLGNAPPETQRRACLFIGKYGSQTEWSSLETAMDSSQDETVRCALAAAGQMGKRIPLYEPFDEYHQRLQSLLGHPNGLIRADAALALCCRRDQTGYEAVRRFLLERDETLRLYLVSEMGNTGDTDLVPLLISQLDSAGSIRMAALASLPELVGTDVSLAGANSTPTIQERVDMWKSFR